MLAELEAYPSARFMLLMASSISCVLLKPIVAPSILAFWKANLITFTRHPMHYRSIVNAHIQEFFSKPGMHHSMHRASMAPAAAAGRMSYSMRRLRKLRFR
jgi:hypothetical protein